ncbi:hypothetical protein [Ichthyobacterium seriolicida]|nr:hypothetical protein [Ichthyobacterium seriolicida]
MYSNFSKLILGVLLVSITFSCIKEKYITDKPTDKTTSNKSLITEFKLLVSQNPDKIGNTDVVAQEVTFENSKFYVLLLPHGLNPGTTTFIPKITVSEGTISPPTGEAVELANIVKNGADIDIHNSGQEYTITSRDKSVHKYRVIAISAPSGIDVSKTIITANTLKGLESEAINPVVNDLDETIVFGSLTNADLENSFSEDSFSLDISVAVTTTNNKHLSIVTPTTANFKKKGFSDEESRIYEADLPITYTVYGKKFIRTYKATIYRENIVFAKVKATKRVFDEAVAEAAAKNVIAKAAAETAKNSAITAKEFTDTILATATDIKKKFWSFTPPAIMIGTIIRKLTKVSQAASSAADLANTSTEAVNATNSEAAFEAAEAAEAAANDALETVKFFRNSPAFIIAKGIIGDKAETNSNMVITGLTYMFPAAKNDAKIAADASKETANALKKVDDARTAYESAKADAGINIE